MSNQNQYFKKTDTNGNLSFYQKGKKGIKHLLTVNKTQSKVVSRQAYYIEGVENLESMDFNSFQYEYTLNSFPDWNFPKPELKNITLKPSDVAPLVHQANRKGWAFMLFVYMGYCPLCKTVGKEVRKVADALNVYDDTDPTLIKEARVLGAAGHATLIRSSKLPYFQGSLGLPDVVFYDGRGNHFFLPQSHMNKAKMLEYFANVGVYPKGQKLQSNA